MSTTGFVDESKRDAYLMALCLGTSADLRDVATALRRLNVPEHIKKEGKSRRRLILSTIVRCRLTIIVYNAGRERPERAARASCLRSIVEDSARLGVGRLVIDRDDTMVRSDNQVLIEATRHSGCRDTLRYEHHDGRSEPLIALPDAIAWAWAAGGEWRSRVEPVVDLRLV